MQSIEETSQHARTNAIRAAAALMLVVAGTTGCAGESSNTDDDIGTSTPSASVAAASTEGGLGDACALIRAEEIAAIVREPVTARPETGGANKTTCTYESPAGNMTWFGLTVTWRGGRESWEIMQSGTALAIDVMSKQFSNEGVNVDSIVRPGPVASLGDAAVFSDLMPSAILKGDTLIEMLVTFLPDPERHFVPLGRKALARL